MKHIQLLVAFACIVITDLSAQGFRRLYPQSYINAVAATADGGFIFNTRASDTTTLVKTDPEGNVVWSRSHLMPGPDDYLTTDLFVLPNGHYALGLYPNITATTLVMVYDAIGNPLGQRTFLGTCPLSPVNNELYLVQPNWDTTYNIIRLDGALGTLWEKKVKTAPVLVLPDKSILDMTTTSDGGLCLQTTFDSSLIFPKTTRLIKFDANGDVQWERGFGLPNAIYYGHLAQAANGDFILENVTGTIGSTIIRTNPAGQQIWSKQVLHTVRSMCLMQDGGIALIGIGKGSTPNWALTKLDANGELLFTKSLYPFNSSFSVIGSDIEPTPDGGLVSCAYVSPDGALAKTDANGNLYDAFIQGHAIYDRNHDCVTGPLDKPLPGWLVTATLGTYTESAITDSTGFYEINLPVGDCVVQIHPPASIWDPCDGGAYPLTTVYHDTLQQDFLVKDSALCSLLDVSLGAPLLRPCFNAVYKVSWCNKGTALAQDASIAVILPPELDFLSSSIPVALHAGDTLWYNLGNIDFSECGDFNVQVKVNCDSAQAGQTLCTKAHIFPDTLCLRPSNWSGAQVVADVRCVGDTTVEFTLKNIGDAPTQVLGYIITEDHVVLYNQNFNLAPGQDMMVERQANGSTQRIEAEQEPGYPFPSMPSAAIEGCGGWNAAGQINRYSLNDADPFTDIDCREVTSSFDPNDKQGFPFGYSDEHLIEPESELTYLIRFQNTGTDTAFYVEVRDTLSSWFDPATLRVGAASHDFTWNMRLGNALSFRFDNILLPDSNTNEAASHGFIQFRIQPKKDAPLGTLLENSASIYFDFNLPVLTNTTFHRLGRDFYLVTVLKTPGDTYLPVQVAPNPFHDYTRILLPPDAAGDYQFRLYGATGSLVRSIDFFGTELTLSAADLTQGYYWFEIDNKEGVIVTRGKMLRQ